MQPHSFFFHAVEMFSTYGKKRQRKKNRNEINLPTQNDFICGFVSLSLSLTFIISAISKWCFKNVFVYTSIGCYRGHLKMNEFTSIAEIQSNKTTCTHQDTSFFLQFFFLLNVKYFMSYIFNCTHIKGITLWHGTFVYFRMFMRLCACLCVTKHENKVSVSLK